MTLKVPSLNFRPRKARPFKKLTGTKSGDAVFFVCDEATKAAKFSGQIRTRIGQDLNLIEHNTFKFCWIVDFPMYELNEETGKIDFNHNPFPCLKVAFRL